MIEVLITDKVYRISEKIRAKYYFNEEKVNLDLVLLNKIMEHVEPEDKARVEKVQHRLVEKPNCILVKITFLGPEYKKDFKFQVNLGQYKNWSSQNAS